jgi:predicted FMN-binding regulatory protein PaiB
MARRRIQRQSEAGSFSLVHVAEALTQWYALHAENWLVVFPGGKDANSPSWQQPRRPDLFRRIKSNL